MRNIKLCNWLQLGSLHDDMRTSSQLSLMLLLIYTQLTLVNICSNFNNFFNHFKWCQWVHGPRGGWGAPDIYYERWLCMLAPAVNSVWLMAMWLSEQTVDSVVERILCDEIVCWESCMRHVERCRRNSFSWSPSWMSWRLPRPWWLKLLRTLPRHVTWLTALTAILYNTSTSSSHFTCIYLHIFT